MTTLDVTQIRARAAAMDPMRVLIGIFTLIPFVLGFGLRFVWTLIALLLSSAQEGWKTASEGIEARQRRAADR